jgi:hypothetical protein
MIDLAKVSRKYWYDDLWKMQLVKKLRRGGSITDMITSTN